MRLREILLATLIIGSASCLIYKLHEEAPLLQKQADEFNRRELKGTIKFLAPQSASTIKLQLNTSDTVYKFIARSRPDADFWGFTKVGDTFIKHAYGDSITIIHNGVSQSFEIGGNQ